MAKCELDSGGVVRCVEILPGYRNSVHQIVLLHDEKEEYLLQLNRLSAYIVSDDYQKLWGKYIRDFSRREVIGFFKNSRDMGLSKAILRLFRPSMLYAIIRTMRDLCIGYSHKSSRTL